MYHDAGAAPKGAMGLTNTTDDIVKIVVRGAVLAGLAAMVAMAWTRNVNWDEFYFLSHVHAHLGGTLDRPLQTFFVHGFTWLPWVSANEVDQIAVARLVMMLFFLGTCLSLHRIAAHLTDETSADIAVLAFVASGFAIAHGASFRADPMAAGLLMGSVAVMMTTRMGLWQVIAVAVMSALALLVTVKAALFLPVYIAALLWRWEDRAVVLRCLAAGVLGLAIAGALFFWHASGITSSEGTAASDNLGEAARLTLGGQSVLPRLHEVMLWGLLSAGAVVLAIAGLLIAPTRRLLVVLILFAGPLLSVVLYRNAFPYFFPFAVPAFMVAVALGAQAFRGSLIWKLGLVLMLASGGLQTVRALSEDNAAQHATLAEVHRLFPEPVPYIDQNAMVSSFPRPGFFMSTWGIANYRAEGTPVFADLIEAHKPPMLLANRDELYAVMRPETVTEPIIGLLEEDAEVLRQTYVHYAGVIWLAGRELTLDQGAVAVAMPFAGRYRVEMDGMLEINGQPVAGGDVLELGKSPIQITGPAGTKVRLIWNTAAGTSAAPLPETGLYDGFWRL